MAMGYSLNSLRFYHSTVGSFLTVMSSNLCVVLSAEPKVIVRIFEPDDDDGNDDEKGHWVLYQDRNGIKV